MLSSDKSPHARAIRRGLPVTKRRVAYIQDKISGGGGGGTGGGHRNDRSYANERSSPNASTASSQSVPAVKKVSRGAIHGGGGPAHGKAKAADRQAKERGGEEEEEAGADFLAELRERFAVDTEELAGDADLDLLADDALFAAPPAVSADEPFSGEEDGDEEAREGEAGAATAPGTEGGEGRAAAQGKEEGPDNRALRLLEEIKTMKVCKGQHPCFPVTQSVQNSEVFGGNGNGHKSVLI